MYSRKSKAGGGDKALSHEEQQEKIREVRRLLGPLADRFPSLCSDASILRYLRARSWDPNKSSKMLKQTLKWRLELKPESIRWGDVAHEAETGKIYRANYLDKYGRAVLVMRPGFQNTSSTRGQIRYLVYCMENAIMNLPPDQEQMVWLIDFQGWSMGSISVKVTRETTTVLQDYYPERLALGILHNPPRIFESFWKIVKPLLDKETYKKVRFVYSDDPDSQKIMTDLFDKNKLESAFGGLNQVGFDFNSYAERMREDDKKMSAFLNSGGSVLSSQESSSLVSTLQPSVSDALLQASSDSSSSSDNESLVAVHIETPNDNEKNVQLNCSESGVAANSETKPELINCSESGAAAISETKPELINCSESGAAANSETKPELINCSESGAAANSETKPELINCSESGAAAISEIKPELINCSESGAVAISETKPELINCRESGAAAISETKPELINCSESGVAANSETKPELINCSESGAAAISEIKPELINCSESGAVAISETKPELIQIQVRESA